MDDCILIQWSKDSSLLNLRSTLKSLASFSQYVPLIVWCTTDCTLELTDSQLQSSFDGSVRVRVYRDQSPFLGDLSASLAVMELLQCSNVLICRPGVIFGPRCLQFLLEKQSEYGDKAVLTGFGIRIFPHFELPVLSNGVHYKLYESNKTDRAVHLFTCDFCVINIQTLLQLSFYFNKETTYQLGNLWCSFFIGHFLAKSHRIWKILIENDVANLSACQPSLIPVTAHLAEFEYFYSHIMDQGWPPGVNIPFYQLAKTPKLPEASTPIAVTWNRGFGGVNMSLGPASILDFKAIYHCGVTVVRCGAVAGASDLSYLINLKAKSYEEDYEHFQNVLPRLRKSLKEVGDQGLKVILTMADLPGVPFHKNKNSSSVDLFWTSSDAMKRAIKFWGLMAKGLQDLSGHLVVGYDLINEPYTLSGNGYFDEISLSYLDQLELFYAECINEIRQYDNNVMIILSSIEYAHPKGLKNFHALTDPNVVYSFHMYTPPLLTLPHYRGDPLYSYPGLIRRWPNYPDDLIQIDKNMIYEFLKDSVYTWQLENGIPSSRILVGEFGICREVPGAQQYLKDALEIFKEFGWSWCLFSFRDEEWDAMDYELGTDINNMLNRSVTPLFLTVAEHFH